MAGRFVQLVIMYSHNGFPIGSVLSQRQVFIGERCFPAASATNYAINYGADNLARDRQKKHAGERKRATGLFSANS